MSDHDARERIRHDLDTNLVVEAAAGTGKTTELVLRIVAMLVAGLPTSQIVAVTFTDKAAGELKLRLRAELEAARADEKTRGPAESALARLEEAQVSTIHTLASELLRERPFEAGVDPDFELCDDKRAARVFEEAFRIWFDDTMQRPGPGVRRALLRGGRRVKADALLDAARKLHEVRHFKRPWTAPVRDRAAEIAHAHARVVALHDLARAPKNPADRLYQSLSGGLAIAESLGAGLDADDLEARLCELAHDRDFLRPRRGQGFYGAADRADVLRAHAEAVEALDVLAPAADAELAYLLKAELGGVLDAYERLKRERSLVDFDDLVERALFLLTSSPSALAHYGRRFGRILVDEFQDTDAAQAELLLLLASGSRFDAEAPHAIPPGKLFIVGDPKQSIYRFRNADLASYGLVKDRIVASGGEVLALSRSFRSVPSIQSFVNRSFARAMSEDEASLQPGYRPLARHRDEHDAQPGVVVLPVPRPYARRLNLQAINGSYPEALAGWLGWLFEESRYTIESRGGAREPIRPRHVAILLRNAKFYGEDRAAPFVEALADLGIPGLVVGGSSVRPREEVDALWAALAAIEWPDDLLWVYAALHGPLFGFSDAALLAFKDAHGHLHPRRKVELAADAVGADVADALTMLGELHGRRNGRPVTATIDDLLARTRAHVGIGLRPDGARALANLGGVIGRARTFEAAEGLSFRGVVQHLFDLASQKALVETPVMLHDADAVRIMTVHAAKGLEFPVVCLGDLTAKTRQRVERHTDLRTGLGVVRLMDASPHELRAAEPLESSREAAESVRIAYVAATRARDLLVVPLVADEPRYPEESWIDPLLGTIAEAAPFGDGARIDGGVVGAPPFGEDAVVDRPLERPSRTLRPGSYLVGDTPIAVWDPHVVLGRPRRPRAIERLALLVPAADATAPTGDTARDAFEARRTARIEAGATPTTRATTVTALSRTTAERIAAGELPGTVAAPERVRVERTTRRAGRPGGKRFGILVHATLARVDLDASSDVVARTVAALARLSGADAAEIEHAAIAVDAALRHPLIDAARAARVCKRELPLTYVRDESGEVVEGIADIAFANDAGWQIVDFKTDDPDAPGKDFTAYRVQVVAYAHAFAEATGTPAHPVLFFV